MKPPTVSTEWLLDSPIWIERLVRRDLLEDLPEGEDLLRREGLMYPAIADWLSLLADWPGPAIKGHKTLALLIHKLDFLSDIGLQHQDPEAAGITDRILNNTSPEGPFQLPILMPKAFGGSGDVENTWVLTDAPVVIGALAKMGLSNHPSVLKASRYIANLVRENGWPCAAGPEAGRFRGPGKQSDSCPYANLVSLRMISDVGLYGDFSSRGKRDVHYSNPENSGENRLFCEASEKGIGALLQFWEQRKEKKFFMFGMGTDFLKLKAPFVWFDILHVLEVLSRFTESRTDKRFGEMLDHAASQANNQGQFTASSIYRPASGFDFGDKKEPSRWISFIMARIFKRME